MGTLPKSGSAEVEVTATVQQVWDLLTDLERCAEWSHENKGGDWLDGATAPTAGARFRGRNHSGRNKWTRTCEVLAVDAPRAISWRTVPCRLHPDSTVWTYELTPTPAGCRITQRFEVRKLNPVLDRLYYAVVPAHRDRSAALADDLRRLGEVAGQVPMARAGRTG